MSLQPLLAASAAIQIHAFAAMAAFLVGIAQFAGPKGNRYHRTMGYVWVGLVLLVAGSSVAIQTRGSFSPIHVLSVVVLVITPLAVLAARRHNVARHRLAMTALFAGALLIAGSFTLLPGRIMHQVLIGP